MHFSSIRRGDHRSPLVLAMLASSVLSSAAAAQDARPGARAALLVDEQPQASSEWADVPADLRGAMNADADVVLFDEPGDGALWARGKSYKARFDRASATLVPFFGSNAPQNFPVELRVSSATLGGEALDIGSSKRATRAGDKVSIDRGGVVEEYVLATESLEQRFVFDELRGAGDLVVRMDVASELEGSDLGSTLRFENDIGRVDYGEAFAIDARGQRLALDSTLIDGAIQLRVPADFVAHAALPLVIDPIVTFHTAGSSVFQDIYPDVAFDVTTDRWCIVWTSVWSVTDHDAYARLATGSYVLQPNTITIDFTTDAWTTPKIANNAASDTFLVCATVVPTNPGPADIRGRFVLPASEITGAPFLISPPDGVFRDQPDIGGDPYTGGAEYCVVWERYTSATNLDIEARRVSPSGTLGPIIPIETTPNWYHFPTISNSVGHEFGDSTTVWTVVCQRRVSSSDNDIYGAQILWNGTIVQPLFPIETSSWNETAPVVSTILHSTTSGVAREYMVVYERDYGTDHDLIAALMRGSTLLQKVNIVGAFDPTAWYYDQNGPAVESDGARFLIAFAETVPNSIDVNLYTSSYTWNGSALTACEVRQGLAGTPTQEADVALHSKASSGGPAKDYLAAYAYNSGNNGFDVIGALWRGCSSSYESVCSANGSSGQCPCGLNGDVGRGCQNSVSSQGAYMTMGGEASVQADSAVFHAAVMPPNTTCLLFQGTSLMQAVPFGNGLRCVTGVTTRLGLQQTDANGAASYPQAGGAPISVAGQVPTAGATRYYQTWYRDPQSPCGGTFNLSNALKVIWTP